VTVSRLQTVQLPPHAIPDSNGIAVGDSDNVAWGVDTGPGRAASAPRLTRSR
jgi:hypothetical protein